MTNQIEDYLTHLTNTGRRPSTIRTYRSQINICIDILRGAGMETDARSIGEDEIYFLIRTLDTGEATTRDYITSLGGMLEFYTGISLVKRMRILWNRPVRHRVFITTDDFIRMYSIADDREKVILVLGAFMGLRRNEMQSITLQDIRRDHIIIHGKGHGKDGLVYEQPMPAEVRQIIDRYLVWRRSLTGTDKSEGRLLVWYDKTHGRINRFADRSGRFTDIVKNLGERVGVTATCHSLRRLFCTNLYYGIDGEGGADLVIVRDLMRHASVDTTLDCYINVKDQEKERTLRQFGAKMGVLLNMNKCIT